MALLNQLTFFLQVVLDFIAFVASDVDGVASVAVAELAAVDRQRGSSLQSGHLAKAALYHTVSTNQYVTYFS